jgi:phage shock protein A
MDKKVKKKIDVLHQRLTQLRQKLSGSKAQLDDPEEVRRLEHQIAAAEAEIAKLKTA